MDERKEPLKEIKINNNLVAFGSALFSAWYQYEQLAKTNKAYTTRVKFGYMVGSGTICFFMTKFILDHYINKI